MVHITIHDVATKAEERALVSQIPHPNNANEVLSPILVERKKKQNNSLNRFIAFIDAIGRDKWQQVDVGPKYTADIEIFMQQPVNVPEKVEGVVFEAVKNKNLATAQKQAVRNFLNNLDLND